jgi:hypothetical protein
MILGDTCTVSLSSVCPSRVFSLISSCTPYILIYICHFFTVFILTTFVLVMFSWSFTAMSVSSLGSDTPALYEFLTAPASSILNHWFESEPLKGTLVTDAVIGTMSGPDTPGGG